NMDVGNEIHLRRNNIRSTSRTLRTRTSQAAPHQSRPVKWFYESHYTRTGNFAGFQPLRFMQRRTEREVRWPDVINAAVQIQKRKPDAYIFKAIPEI
ncbi:hypothetical protein TcCL_NonESM00131, partial [Trypanosoma cruzi]